MARLSLVVLVLLAAAAPAAAREAANPIRRVVNMLQSMQSKVTEEGEKEKAIYDKYVCYCKSGSNDLGASIAAAESKISSLPSEIEAAEESNTQAKAALKQAQEDRAAAKEAIAEATALREGEAKTFAALKAESNANTEAIAAAVASLEKGMAGAFLQTGAAQLLRKLTDASGPGSMQEESREAVAAFLQGSRSEYAPSSGQITGILKELGDDMDRDLAAATATEEAAIATYNQLVAAKTKEIGATTAAVEAKTKQIGELGVDIVELKEDLSDTEAAFIEDKKFLADLSKNCLTKSAEWEVVVQTRAQELAALADTIKILNDDDALELFKKTLPGPSAAFMQVEVSNAAMLRNALAVVRGAGAQRANSRHRAQFDLIELALTGKKVSFAKVLQLIDEMVALLKDEQVGDDHKKEYCLKQFDVTDDKKKDLERTQGLEAAAIDKAKEAIANLADEIAALEAGIKALDKSVAEATQQRQEENKDFTELIASDTAAKELIDMARNRLNKFYNPKLYKAPPKEELSAEGRIEASFSFAQISAHSQSLVAPPPPPEAVAAYSKKGGESTGVIAMIDLLIKDLDKEITEAQTGEKEAQKDYETLTADSAEKRAQDSKSLASKVQTKAATEAALQDHQAAANAAQKEHMATLEYEVSLHGECDFLLNNFDARKEARAGEVTSLKTAKEVLSGADFALVQTSRAQKALRGRAA